MAAPRTMLPSLPPTQAETDAVSTSCKTIKPGDLVIVYENPKCMKAVYVSENGRFESRFGSFPHKDWIGTPFGTKVHAKGGSKGWVYLLAPSPDLWSLVLKHRTQILYIADISMVCMYLELAPGCVVLESGTGSGSLTHSLIRAVAPTGHVHTFEFHQERADEARREFERNGLSSCVTVRHRNIEERGFPCGAEGEEEGMVDLTAQVDAVFLDLPAPHKAVPSAATCLAPGGRFCSFSPCIEQVQRTCEALERNGFTELQTYECLLRAWSVHTEWLDNETGARRQPGHGRGSGGPANKRQRTGGREQGQGSGSGAGGEGEGAATEDKGSVQMVVAHPEQDARGHTGYLTFARKFVAA